MKDLDYFCEHLGADQSTQLSDYTASLICDLAVGSGFRFSQEFNGSYSVEPAQVEAAVEGGSMPEWFANVVTLTVPEKIPPHNPDYVEVLEDVGDVVTPPQVGHKQVWDVARATALDPRTLRAGFDYVLRWCPDDYITNAADRGYRRYNNLSLKLSALPMVARAVSKNSAVIFQGYRKQPTEHIKEVFLKFCETVLTPPEEQ